MGGLSNLFGRSDAAALSAPRSIVDGELDQALRLLLTYHGHAPSADHLQRFVDFASERGIDFSRMWVVARGRHLVAASLPVPAAGRSALLLCSMPGHHPALARATADCCWATVNAMREDIRLIQILLEPDETAFADALFAVGFERLATLIYLQKTVQETSADACPMRGYKLLRYDAQTHARFARTIDATYAGSLDCPALHGRRSIEDVIAGHKSSGEFDANLWFCLTDGTADLGVLLLAHLPGQETMEIVYLGLTPAARGRQLGDLLLRLAIQQAARQGDKHLTLAVDAANQPALRLYYRNGFGELQQRMALVRFR